jgi:hypothetical protein
MCHERWMRRREKEAEESREIWQDFERTTPIGEPQRPDERPEPERADAPEEPVTLDR